MVVIMDKPWYREWFGRNKESDLQSAGGRDQDEDAETQFHLGLMFSNREGEAQDPAQAVRCYLKAANLNHPLAQFNLGLMYAKGEGVAQNDGEAIIWIRKAAEQGDAGAQFDLGTRCHRSSVKGLEIDAVESKIESYKWFHLAAAQGYKQADASCERLALAMSFEGVAEGNLRVAAFVAAQGVPSAKLSPSEN